ncbi:sensor histidine kinase [Arthrobacter sp. NPDC056727]|uniref:sensor histidine kinase n=1 Tax=Arthrobacter sp. NPDC056727 TaxID=3345927 RepID=UPI00366C8187
MFNSFRQVRVLRAPLSAALLLGTLLVLEQRTFDRNTALLLALTTAIAVAELLPSVGLAWVFFALLLQTFKVFPLVLLSGVLSYVAIPLAVFFATVAWKDRAKWIPPVAATAFAGITTVNWFLDQTWISFVFGNQLYGRGVLRTIAYVFLIFGAFAALNLVAWVAGHASNNADRSRKAQLAAESRLQEASTELVLERERNRIARELHDVLAHSLTVIVAQADGIRFIHRTEPQLVEEASEIIAASARAALVETRRLIEGFATDLKHEPGQRAEDVAALADRMTQSGMPVKIETSGTPWDMTPAQHLTVYRLAQESLTNAFKHADRSRGVHLQFLWKPEAVELRVRSSLQTSTTDTKTSDSSALGRGLSGMKARAAAAGGWVETINGEETFEVLAFLPATEKSASDAPDGRVISARPVEGANA